jgi:hypothetical protein
MYGLKDDWLVQVVPEIQSRMAKYAEKEVRFNIMAIVGDRLEAAERRVRRSLKHIILEFLKFESTRI